MSSYMFFYRDQPHVNSFCQARERSDGNLAAAVAGDCSPFDEPITVASPAPGELAGRLRLDGLRYSYYVRVLVSVSRNTVLDSSCAQISMTRSEF